MSALPLRRLLLPTLALALTACSAGVAEPTPLDVGHGGVEQVIEVLEKQRQPCTDLETRAADKELYEQRSACTFDGTRVEILHFFNPQGAETLRDNVKGSGGHGAFAEAYAITTPDRETAERLAGLLLGAEAF